MSRIYRAVHNLGIIPVKRSTLVSYKESVRFITFKLIKYSEKYLVNLLIA